MTFFTPVNAWREVRVDLIALLDRNPGHLHVVLVGGARIDIDSSAQAALVAEALGRWTESTAYGEDLWVKISSGCEVRVDLIATHSLANNTITLRGDGNDTEFSVYPAYGLQLRRQINKWCDWVSASSRH